MSLVFCTNNSRQTIAQYRDKLQRMGVDTEDGEVLTSAIVTGETLAARGFGGSRAIVIGGEGLRESLAAADVDIDDDPLAGSADVVVVGFDTSFTYDAMRRAALALRGGAAFVATNVDATFPAAGGALWPGAGAIVASLVTASGRHPEVMGKPHPPMMDAAARRLGDARDIAIVGDRPDTDLSGGAAKGWRTILVLSGVTSSSDVSSVRPRPDIVLESLADLSF